ncbi:MAG: hypothetical protein AAGC95_00870 [Pseudomonadota bacterium]
MAVGCSLRLKNVSANGGVLLQTEGWFGGEGVNVFHPLEDRGIAGIGLAAAD